jgi:hypothetical protein
MPEGRCAAMLLAARCNAMFQLRQLYAATLADELFYK